MRQKVSAYVVVVCGYNIKHKGMNLLENILSIKMRMLQD